MSTAPKRNLKWGLSLCSAFRKYVNFTANHLWSTFASTIDIFANDNTTAGSIPAVLLLWSN
jgi:hypothetical protein